MTSRFLLFTCATTMLASSATYAGVGKISSPTVTKGVAEIEYSGTRYGDNKKLLNNKQSHTYEIEYGVTDRLLLGFEGKSARASGDKHIFNAYGAEAQYMVTEQGDWWLNTGIKAEYLQATQSNKTNEIEAKWLASKKLGSTQVVFNLGFAKEVGNHSESGLAVETALQGSHKINEYISPGLEWHADYGKLNKLDKGNQHAHYVGPILTGDLFHTNNGEVEYTVGYFWGLGNNAADNAARLEIGYEFAF